jgi:hypothetical protein
VSIIRALEGSAFGPEAIDEITKAFQAAIETLGIADEPSKDLAAKVILGLAAEKEVLDARNLSDEAILKLKAFLEDQAGAPNPLSPHG